MMIQDNNRLAFNERERAIMLNVAFFMQRQKRTTRLYTESEIIQFLNERYRADVVRFLLECFNQEKNLNL